MAGGNEIDRLGHHVISNRIRNTLDLSAALDDVQAVCTRLRCLVAEVLILTDDHQV